MDVVISAARERLFGSGGAVDFSALFPALNRALTASIVQRRWFGSKARTIRDVALADWFPLTPDACLLLVRVDYAKGDAETYAIPLGLARSAAGEAPAGNVATSGAPLIARLVITPGDESAVLYDAMADAAVARRWLEMIAGGQEIAGRHGRLVGARQKRFDALRGMAAVPLEPRILQAEQSNSSILFGDRLILKLFRRCEAGVNPDVEVTSYLTTRLGFSHVPPVAGTIEYQRPGEAAVSLAVMQGFVANHGDAWRHTLARLNDFFKRVAALPGGGRSGANFPDEAIVPDEALLATAERAIPALAAELIGPYLAEAELLGRRTAELHLALATETNEADFKPEPFTPSDQRSFYDTSSRLIRETFMQLTERLVALTPAVRVSAERLLGLEGAIQNRFRAWIDRPVSGLRTRVHGDYHLGQVLWTGHDFMIIDFEGEPARPMAERRLKQSPLRDVAGMLRSFHYATGAALESLAAADTGQDSTDVSERRAARAAWARVWHVWSSAAFLRSYLARTAGASFLPERQHDLGWLLDEFLLEKAVYELRYELNNRPDWVPIPLDAVLALAATPSGGD
jgi:trehalose synthase-fused probable maltokinase